MYEVYENGFLILTINEQNGQKFANDIVNAFHMFGRPKVSLWHNGQCLVHEGMPFKQDMFPNKHVECDEVTAKAVGY